MEQGYDSQLANWYETLSYQDAKEILEEKLQYMSSNFIAAGYFMKYIRDKELYKEDGYSSIWEFAEDNYGIKRTTASRWMAMNDKFSKDGNTPILADEYKVFGKSQLQEMLYLGDKQMEEVTPGMTVKEIREVRKPEVEVKLEPHKRGCITGKSPYGNCVCCGNEGTVECCAQCDNDCNSRCGWIKEKSDECATSHIDDELPEQMHIKKDFSEYFPEPIKSIEEDDVLLEEPEQEDDWEYAEVIIDEEPLESEVLSEIDEEIKLARLELIKEQNYLDTAIAEFGSEGRMTNKAKVRVAAFANYIAELELLQLRKVIQPELPQLKNNDQRKEFLHSFHDWPVWFSVPEADETYYRYDLSDGTSIVVCEYKMYSEWKKIYYKEDPESVDTRLYLLSVDYHYLNGCKTNESALVEHLKNLQKGDK